ncbi:hypothetical protein EVAR_49606_1 [Eumeta japonica]|uniref:Uncharacterized protein n=1 Tax=Eumeta variegata TaxID=151549 RepID=A0A4C1Y435_EUMVA|nr:hypothetical protein EVAR_49606_1 [Eumeta japonica]
MTEGAGGSPLQRSDKGQSGACAMRVDRPADEFELLLNNIAVARQKAEVCARQVEDARLVIQFISSDKHDTQLHLSTELTIVTSEMLATGAPPPRGSPRRLTFYYFYANLLVAPVE